MPQPTFASPKSILVIDDDQYQRRSLALILKRAGYRVVTVARGREALDYLVSSHFDLVILDVVKFDNQGTLLQSFLRLYPHLPMLVFTSGWSPEMDSELGQLGIRAHLSKPVTPACLLECVQTILE
jgi:DNA-binding NtrC family response regulator